MDKIKVIFQGKAQTRFKVRKTTARKSKRTTTKVTYKAHEIYFSMANCELCFSSKKLIHNFSHSVKINLDENWIPRNIYSSNLTPERMDLRKNKTFWGTTFYFPRSTGQLSAKRSEARQSWRSRKGKSWPEESFVLPKIRFLSGVRFRGYIFSL